MIGADVAPHIVIVTGIAGALADALSMGSSGYLAAKSEAEVAARHRDGARRDPPDAGVEEEELALIYEAKGSRRRPRATAAHAHARPRACARRQGARGARHPRAGSHAAADGLVTGMATAIGALIPILPFLLPSPPGAAIWVSLTVSVFAHFGVGAARSVFTGRGLWASGRDMFLVGFGVAAIGYVIGIGLEQAMGGFGSSPISPTP